MCMPHLLTHIKHRSAAVNTNHVTNYVRNPLRRLAEELPAEVAGVTRESKETQAGPGDIPTGPHNSVNLLSSTADEASEQILKFGVTFDLHWCCVSSARCRGERWTPSLLHACICVS